MTTIIKRRLRDEMEPRPAVRKGEESSQGSAARDAITPIVANIDIPMNSFADSYVTGTVA